MNRLTKIRIKENIMIITVVVVGTCFFVWAGNRVESNRQAQTDTLTARVTELEARADVNEQVHDGLKGAVGVGASYQNEFMESMLKGAPETLIVKHTYYWMESCTRSCHL